MQYSAILFDMDGTLLETGHIWNQATRLALSAHDIELTEEEHFSLGGLLLELLLEEKGHDPHTIDAVRLMRDDAMAPLIRESAEWKEGALELLSELDIPTAIVTSAHDPIVSAIKEKLNLENYFDTIVIADDVRPDYKPHPKGLLLACERMGVDPTTCLYIGDQDCDLKAAANAGMDAILIKGMHTPKELMHERMVADFAELRALLT